jgi:hypothetical protein
VYSPFEFLVCWTSLWPIVVSVEVFLPPSLKRMSFPLSLSLTLSPSGAHRMPGGPSTLSRSLLFISHGAFCVVNRVVVSTGLGEEIEGEDEKEDSRQEEEEGPREWRSLDLQSVRKRENLLREEREEERERRERERERERRRGRKREREEEGGERAYRLFSQHFMNDKMG